MRIIHVPHPTLRQVAKPVTELDTKIEQLITGLETTLQGHQNPAGVGLAAPQVDRPWRIFATFLPIDPDNEDSPSVIRHYINPTITKISGKSTLGSDKKQPILEGCLSIPGLYGPVPRWEWVELEYQLNDSGRLVTKKDRFSDFAARVIQHEYDHLEGRLFTDYSLEYDLPLYQENFQTKKLEPVTPEIAAHF